MAIEQALRNTMPASNDEALKDGRAKSTPSVIPPSRSSSDTSDSQYGSDVPSGSNADSVTSGFLRQLGQNDAPD